MAAAATAAAAHSSGSPLPPRAPSSSSSSLQAVAVTAAAPSPPMISGRDITLLATIRRPSWTGGGGGGGGGGGEGSSGALFLPPLPPPSQQQNQQPSRLRPASGSPSPAMFGSSGVSLGGVGTPSAELLLMGGGAAGSLPRWSPAAATAKAACPPAAGQADVGEPLRASALQEQEEQQQQQQQQPPAAAAPVLPALEPLLPPLPFALDDAAASPLCQGAPGDGDDEDASRDVAVGRFVELLRSAAPLAAVGVQQQQQQQQQRRRRKDGTAAAALAAQRAEVAALAAKLRPLLIG